MIPTIGRWAHAPDLIEPIVGYRAWRCTTNDRAVQLFSFVTADDHLPNEWEGAWARWVTASCLFPRGSIHPAPDESCTCGFYAVKSFDDPAAFEMAILLQAGSLQAGGADGAVFGRVQLAGKVIEHATGYRAERARIAELIPTTTDAGVTLSLASRLHLPLGPAWDTAPLLREREELLRCLSPTERPWRPGLLDRWRLMTHRRQFTLIQGAGPADDPGAKSPRPSDPHGGSSPPAA